MTEEKINRISDNIKSNYQVLFPQEKKVAKYILNNMSEVVMLNISDLASKTKTSEATVVRMCKHIGYNGYYQMRLLLSREIGKYENQNENEELNTSRKIFAYHGARVEYLSENINDETLLNVSKILLNSSNTHIIGVGNTIPVVMDLGFRLERHGFPCTYSILPEHFYNHITLGNDQNVVIAISRSGASTQIIRAVEMAHRKAMKIIVITGELNKQLIEHADEVIRVVEKNNSESMDIKPDSHLLEIAINDAIIYSVNKYKKITNNTKHNLAEKENMELFLSEFKL